MPEILRYQPGSFCWTELLTDDAEGASRFYSDLFGWTPEHVGNGSGEKGTAMRIAGKDVAAVREVHHANGGSGRSHWFCYVAVKDVDESAARAAQLGGLVIGGVWGSLETSRVATVRDPIGATIGLWQPGSHIGARLGLELNTVCWTELASSDPVVSAGFYSALFGWTVREEGGYLEYLLSGSSQAGMVQLEDEGPSITSQWGVYFRVDDCDTAAAEALALGGSVLVQPTDVRGVGRFSRLSDPGGAVFSVIKLGED